MTGNSFEDAKMRILALDTATAACSVALLEDGRILARDWRAMHQGHAQALMPMVVAVMGAEPYSTLDAVAVTVGPGSFTGIRVGLAAARGLGLAAGRPVLGVTTFEAIARALAPAERAGRRVLVAVETRRCDLYLQLLAPDLTPLRPASVLPVEAAADYAGPGPLLVAGDGAARAAAGFAAGAVIVARGPGLPDAAEVAHAAAERLRRFGPPAAPPAAFYLRAADTTLPRARS